jgi:periplasmic mercuric ion binding protein
VTNKLAAFLTFALVAGSALAGEAKTVTLAVSNMDCAACPITVRKALERIPGVATAKVDFKSKLAVVSFDPSKTGVEALTRATTDAGYPSSVKQVR